MKTAQDKIFSLITCVREVSEYRKNVLNSFSRREKKFIEFIPIINEVNHYSSAQALNKGAEHAMAKYLIFCHQDVIFGKNWLKKIRGQINKLPSNWGVIGPAGAAIENDVVKTKGDFFQGDTRIAAGELPTEVESIDECCFIIKRKAWEAGLKFDLNLPGHHLYGLDLCWQAKDAGQKNFAIKAPIKHLSSGNRDQQFWRNVVFFRQKWGNKNGPIGATFLTPYQVENAEIFFPGGWRNIF